MRKKADNYKNNTKKILILIACIILIIIIIRFTYSRFQNNVNAVTSLDAAFYVVDERYQSMNINLGTIEPNATKYEYVFTVSNYDEQGNRAEVNLEYELSVATTTNLPLEYDLFMNGSNTSAIVSNIVEADEDGTYFRKLTTEKQTFLYSADGTNTYKLTIYFNPIYRDIKYQDVIEGVEIQVNSRQIID